MFHMLGARRRPPAGSGRALSGEHCPAGVVEVGVVLAEVLGRERLEGLQTVGEAGRRVAVFHGHHRALRIHVEIRRYAGHVVEVAGHGG